MAEPAGAASDPAYGLADPAATIEIAYKAHPPAAEGKDAAPAQAEPRTLRVTLGREVDAASGKRYAAKSGDPHAVTLSKYDAEEVAGKKLADLLTPPSSGRSHS
jgi:hypothetical protein